MSLDTSRFLEFLRRWRVVAIAMGIGAFFGLGATALWWWQHRVPLTPNFGLSHSDPDRWRVAGRKYLEKHPEEASSDALAKLLLEGSAKEGSAQAFLEKRIQDDLAQNRVVVVDGWVLSITEARLAALAAMMADGRAGKARSTAAEGIEKRGD